MSPKQQYTELWKFLSLTEDYFRYGKKSGDYEPPELTVSRAPVQQAIKDSSSGPAKTVRPNTVHPLVHLKTESVCQGCGIARMGKKPVAAMGTEKPQLLVLCGPPSVDANRIRFPWRPKRWTIF